MAQSYYTAITKNPSSSLSTHQALSHKVDQSAELREQINSLTKQLKQSFADNKMLNDAIAQMRQEMESVYTENKKLKKEKESVTTESKLFASVCDKLEREAEKTKKIMSDMTVTYKQALMNHHEETSVKSNTLNERCKSLASLAEQHRIATRKLKDKIEQHDEEKRKLNSSVKELSEKVLFSKELLKKACSVLKNSSEVLSLASEAANNTDPVQMKVWLGEVCCAMNGLEKEMRET